MIVFLNLEALWRLHLKQRWSYRVAWVLSLIGVIVELGIVLFLGRLLGAAPGSRFSAEEYLGFAAVGVSVTGFVAGMTASSASWVREGQLTGTLEGVLLSPVPHWLVVLLAGLVAVPGLVARLALELVCASMLGAEFSLDVAGIGLLLLLSLATVVPVGLIASAAVLFIKKGDIVTYAVSTASILLSGAYFPRDLMPEPLQHLAALVPTTHVLDYARVTLLGGENVGNLSALAGYAVGIWPVGACALAFALKFGKIHGSTGQY